MKKHSLLFILLLAVALVLSACVQPVVPKHECKHVCPTCGKCTNSACTEPECAEKCPGHNDPKPPENTVTKTEVVLYDGPQVMQSSASAKVKIEGKDAFVYDTRVNHGRSFTYTYSKDYNQVVVFDFQGSVTVEIEIVGASELHNVTVRPLSRGVSPNVVGNKITLQLDYTDNYVVEYGTTESEVASNNAIHLFANPLETDPVDPNNLPANTVYVGPGVWMANALPVNSDDTTVYLAGGAVVYGQIRTANMKNLTIRGRGILAGELFDRTKASEFTLPIELQNCQNVTIKDITILDPAGWAVTLYKCKDVTIENLKIVTARANGDGISVQSCQNVNVKGGFVRSWDDSLVVKNVDNQSTSDITFDGVYVWTDLAQSMEVGYETYGPKMENITFKNITVLHNFHKAAMSIHNADNAAISHVSYENITIEDAQMLGDNQLDGENDFLIDITIAYNAEWTQSGGARGSVSDVTFKNIKVLQMADTIICRAFGESTASNVSDVTVQDVEIEGKRVSSLNDIGLVAGAYTNNVTYNDSKAAIIGAAVTLPYNLQLEQGSQPQVTVVANIAQEGLQVPQFAVLNNQPTYAGKLIDTSNVVVTATYGEGDRAKSEWNKAPVTDVEGHEVANLLDGDRTTEWVFDAWTGVEKEFVALSFNFDSPTRIGNIRFLGSTASDIMRYYTVSMFVKAGSADANWTRFQPATEISLSPQASNYQDFLINLDGYSGGCYGLQLRFFAKDDLTHPKTIALGEIEFYPPSLTTGKPVDASAHEDVYDMNKINDGDTLTYFESKKGVFPAFIQIDMGNTENVKYVNIHLPPLLLWENRTQEIEILGSLDGVTFFTVVAKTEYLFDSSTGNMINLVLDTPVQMRYIKLVYTSNSTGYGAQISELYVYGE